MANRESPVGREGRRVRREHARQLAKEILQTNKESAKHLNVGDSISLLGLLFGVVLVIVIPALLAKVVLLVGVCIGCYVFVGKSHWTHDWSKIKKYSAASGVVAVLSISAVPQFVSEWKNASTHGFVFIIPGPVVNTDSWDFIVTPKGSDKVESIDVEFTDVNKLEYVQRNTPAGVNVLPREYSVLLHYDQLFPRGRGSLYAKQFVWKPFAFEHGHYRSDISASTGRFHEELYVEKIDTHWWFAAMVTDIDTHDNLFMCKDSAFPSKLATSILTTNKCWPDMME